MCVVCCGKNDDKNKYTKTKPPLETSVYYRMAWQRQEEVRGSHVLRPGQEGLGRPYDW